MNCFDTIFASSLFSPFDLYQLLLPRTCHKISKLVKLIHHIMKKKKKKTPRKKFHHIVNTFEKIEKLKMFWKKKQEQVLTNGRQVKNKNEN